MQLARNLSVMKVLLFCTITFQDKTLPAKVRLCRLLSQMSPSYWALWEQRCSPAAWMKGDPEEEESAVSLWGAVVVAAEEVADDLEQLGHL